MTRVRRKAAAVIAVSAVLAVAAGSRTPDTKSTNHGAAATTNGQGAPRGAAGGAGRRVPRVRDRDRPRRVRARERVAAVDGDPWPVRRLAPQHPSRPSRPRVIRTPITGPIFIRLV